MAVSALLGAAATVTVCSLSSYKAVLVVALAMTMPHLALLEMHEVVDVTVFYPHTHVHTMPMYTPWSACPHTHTHTHTNQYTAIVSTARQYPSLSALQVLRAYPFKGTELCLNMECLDYCCQPASQPACVGVWPLHRAPAGNSQWGHWSLCWGQRWWPYSTTLSPSALKSSYPPSPPLLKVLSSSFPSSA